jgi:NTE family protein
MHRSVSPVAVQARRLCALLVCLCAVLATTAAVARPKVCLVLSGGGARGAAHIGVIKVLEEMRIPIDCIAGTSMGSLVGGGYASGMSVAEMERFVAQISTRALFDEKPPRQDQAIRRKLDDRSILYGVEIGLADTLDITLPKGIVSGIELETLMRRLSKVHGYRKFDALAIPYRAVATDLVTGTPVVFSEGELPNVMRASMSVPGAIAPAEIDGQLLVDGGLTNNLPVDVARSMGADVIIAVNLGTPLLQRGELKSLIGVTEQMVNILTEQNVRASLASLKPTDILIEPELGQFSASDFDDLPKTIPIGEAAARKAAPRLAALSTPPDVYAEWHARQAQVSPPDAAPVDEIRFHAMQRVNTDTMAGMLETQVHQPINQDTLDRDVRRLFGTGDFEHVNYRILEENGKRVLDIDAVEKSWGPNYMRFGLALGSDFGGEAFFNLAASYRRTWINSLGAEWRNDVQVGRDVRLATEFYQPLETQRYFFVAPRAEYERHNLDVFSDSQRIARYDVHRTYAAFDVGTDLTKYGEARIGVLAGRVNASLDTGPPIAPSVRASEGAFTAQAIIDELDSANFPRNGFSGSAHIFASTKALGADNVYTKWDADWLSAYSYGPHTLQVAAKAGAAFGDQPIPAYDMFTWGGFLQQSGYPTGALLGERLTFGRAVYTYRIAQVQVLGSLYAGVSLEAGRMDKPLVNPGSPTGTLYSIAAFFGVDSPLGPVYLGYGWAADGNRSAYFYLGRP